MLPLLALHRPYSGHISSILRTFHQTPPVWKPRKSIRDMSSTRGICAIRRSPTMARRSSVWRPTLRPARSQGRWPVPFPEDQPAWAKRHWGQLEPVLGDWGVPGPKDVDHKRYWSKNGIEKTFYKICIYVVSLRYLWYSNGNLKIWYL